MSRKNLKDYHKTSINRFLINLVSILVNDFRFIALFFYKYLSMFYTFFIWALLFIIICLINYFIGTVFNSHIIMSLLVNIISCENSFSMFGPIFKLPYKDVSIIINNFCFTFLFIILKSPNVVIFRRFKDSFAMLHPIKIVSFVIFIQLYFGHFTLPMEFTIFYCTLVYRFSSKLKNAIIIIF